MPNKKSIGLISGPFCYLFILFVLDIPDLDPAGQSVLASAVWIALWWMTEAIPLAVTALLPMILFPLSGAMTIRETTTPYSHPFIFLYLGGFFIAIAIEKWNLHKRIALNIIRFIGTNVIYIILGFMLATAFLSMWISNTAAAVMLLPVGMAIILQLKDNPDTIEDENRIFGKALMLGIAYSASIGGIATLIGTPPNLVMAGVIKEQFDVTITFSQWLSIGLPVSLLLLLICWLFLTRVAFQFKQKAFPGGKEEVQRQLDSLGVMQSVEKKVLLVFALTAFAWITKSWILEKIIPAIDDTIIALAGGGVLFVLSAGKSGEKILAWKDTLKMPWDIILLFGGGLSLAAGFDQSGLAAWIGSQFLKTGDLSPFILLLIIVISINLLTELTSNLATTAMFLPVLVSIAATAGVSPYILIVGATIAASCAFMLPVATPPNAVVFGSGYIKIHEMIRTGIVLNIISTLLVTLLVYLLLPIVWPGLG